MNLTQQIGTPLYISPELLEESDEAKYNKKVDIYSLGLIYFEMLNNFTTRTERCKRFDDLRAERQEESFKG